MAEPDDGLTYYLPQGLEDDEEGPELKVSEKVVLTQCVRSLNRFPLPFFSYPQHPSRTLLTRKSAYAFRIRFV